MASTADDSCQHTLQTEMNDFASIADKFLPTQASKGLASKGNSRTQVSFFVKPPFATFFTPQRSHQSNAAHKPSHMLGTQSDQLDTSSCTRTMSRLDNLMDWAKVLAKVLDQVME